MDTEPSGDPQPSLTHGLRAPGDEVEAVLQRALGLAEEEEWEAMAEFLRAELEAHPDDPYVLCWLGLAERELGLEGIAFERFKRALDQEPEDPVLLCTAGNAIAAFDDPDAEAALRTAALLAPDLAQARWMYGAYLIREGMLEDGLRELDAAVRLEPDDPVIHLERGVARLLSDELESAVHAFGRSAELAPDDGWPFVLLGLGWIELDELEEGSRALEEGARLRPDDLNAQVMAALALAAVGRDGVALEMLERARLHAEGVDEVLVLEVEERIEEGADSALRFLRSGIGPSSLRERAMERP
jgi:tetratricopeptide (TPR) repeat protein